MSSTLEAELVEIGGEETPLIIMFKRLPTGELAADIKGRMHPQELAEHLRGIADTIEQQGTNTKVQH